MTPSLNIAQHVFRPLARNVNPGDFWSADSEEVSDYVANRLTTHRLHVTESGCTAVELRALTLKSASFCTVQYNKDVVIDGLAGEDSYFLAFEIPSTPADSAWRTQGGGGFKIISPGDRFNLRKRAHSPYLVVKLARETLESRLRDARQVTITDPIRFAPIAANDGDISRFIRDTVAHIAGQAHLFPQFFADARLEGHHVGLLAEVLLTLRHNYTSGIEASGREVLPWHVHRARDLIENAVENGEPLSVADLAMQVGVSVRTLQLGFQRFLGQGPNHYIRSVKLSILNKKLTNAQPNARVTDLMTECGIYDFGRFAHLYRMTYGRTPSDELRRSH